jgi:hypothetical protein
LVVAVAERGGGVGRGCVGKRVGGYHKTCFRSGPSRASVRNLRWWRVLGLGRTSSCRP